MGFFRQLRSSVASPPASEAPTEANEAIAACAERALVTIHGHIDEVATREIDGVTSLEASITDGSEVVTLVWIGRREIRGIEPGRELTAHGRIGRRRDARIIYNPRYELDA